MIINLNKGQRAKAECIDCNHQPCKNYTTYIKCKKYIAYVHKGQSVHKPGTEKVVIREQHEPTWVEANLIEVNISVNNYYKSS